MTGVDPRLERLLRERSYDGLQLLVLFGSRARGEATARADWDVAYLASPSFDPDALLADLTETLGADRIDLVDLARAGGQVRYRVARDGRVLYEQPPGTFRRFWLEAVTFWCDVLPVVERGYAAALRRLVP